METKRVCSPGAEKWLGATMFVLDHGEIELVDYAGTEQQMVGIARISHGRILPHTTDEEAQKLINYLMKNQHTSPFEFIETTWRMKLPIFIARQFGRHRTFNINEQSARYSELESIFYKPSLSRIKPQGKTNRQGSEGELDLKIKEGFIDDIEDVYSESEEKYKRSLDRGVSKETSRIVLPVSTYTNWVVKIDLHNLFHFLKLRHPGTMGDHAQYEAQAYAICMGRVLRDAYPMCWKAFEEYILYSKTYSRSELQKREIANQ